MTPSARKPSTYAPLKATSLLSASPRSPSVWWPRCCGAWHLPVAPARFWIFLRDLKRTCGNIATSINSKKIGDALAKEKHLVAWLGSAQTAPSRGNGFIHERRTSRMWWWVTGLTFFPALGFRCRIYLFVKPKAIATNASDLWGP